VTMEAGRQRARGGYVDANGVRTYWEVEGAGEPLLLLHGGLCAIKTLDGLRRELADRYRVYLPERRGHGRTPDVDGPYSYGQFAEDTIGFMQAVGLSRAHLLGFSDGATVALLVALRRPDLVDTLVHIGQPVNLDGIQPELRDVLSLATMPQGMLPPVLRELYEAASPDGAEHWDVVVDKAWQMIRTEPNLDVADLAAVSPPTLVMVAEHDIPTIAHAEQISRALPKGNLVVVPNAGHGLPMEKPDVVARLVLDFLTQTRPRKLNDDKRQRRPSRGKPDTSPIRVRFKEEDRCPQPHETPPRTWSTSESPRTTRPTSTATPSTSSRSRRPTT
jgi:pimeloyl-ACP methyl ester carboxylesterase